jgi:hypothetical protein
MVIAYPLSGWALAYAGGRGWVSFRSQGAIRNAGFYRPATAAMSGVPREIGDRWVTDRWPALNTACERLGERHAAADRRPAGRAAALMSLAGCGSV